MARASIALVALLVALAAAPAAMCATNFTFSEHDLASEEALSTLYERWCAHHGLTPDMGDKARRFSIFKDKARVVHEFNLGDAPYKLALNHLSDTRGYGGRCVFFNDMEMARRPRTRKHGAVAVAASNLPAESPRSTGVKNQNQGGPCGSCWAFAAVWAVEGIFAIKNNTVTALSEQQVLDTPTGSVFVGPCDGKNHTHAVTVVGYNTTAGRSNYWILRNSWGRNWGEGGYMLLSRDVGGPEGLCGILDYPMFPSCAGNCNHKWWL